AQVPIIGDHLWLIPAGIFVLIVLWFVLRAVIRRGAKSAEDPGHFTEIDELILDEVEEILDEEQVVVSRKDISEFFMKIYKAQLGESQGTLSEIKPLKTESIAPKMTYELRVAHKQNWEVRRMTVEPLGSEDASRSQCFTVIYDDHLVLKIPQKPIRSFKSYIDTIVSDQKIVKKLSPRECIVPSVSAILKKIHSFSDAHILSSFEVEKKYIQWLDKFPSFQDFLKIGDSFIFVMDLSKYFFLGRIIDDFHDLQNRLYQEIVGYPAVIWENHGFEGRYGFENDEAVDGIKDVFSTYHQKVTRLLNAVEDAKSVDSYTLQKWFLIHLAGKELEPTEKGLGAEMVDKLNALILKVLSNKKDAVENYRNTIRGCIQSVTVGQNKRQMGVIISKILDLLAWLRTRGVAMRDLKPDNLLVVGDTARYPDFLKSTEDFSVGLIDVETAVEYNDGDDTEIEQPILGGTPPYAVPAHLCDNATIGFLFGDISRVLYLQDWFSSAGMIYDVVLGERLFDQTGKLLVGIKDLVLKPATGQQELNQAFKKASRMFWYTAISEFKAKTDEKEDHLKSVKVDISDSVREMFRKELLKGKQMTAEKISRCIDGQTVFSEEKLCQGLICASRQKISELKAKLKNGLSGPNHVTKGKARAIKVLQDLEQLKLQSENLSRSITELANPRLILNARDLMELIFDIVLQAMYREEWGEPSAAEGFELEDVSGTTTIESTV
ncbi:MAG: hypothetical protein PVI06_20705, partial [Desulfobacterales bacterium]